MEEEVGKVHHSLSGSHYAQVPEVSRCAGHGHVKHMRLHWVCAMQGQRHMGLHNWQMQESVRQSHEAEMLEVRLSHL